MELKDIPSGSIGYCHTEFDIVSWSIRLLTKKWANHTLLYFGSGRHETVESAARGDVVDTLDNRLNKKNRVRIFANKNLTVEQLQTIKQYAYGRVKANIKYDFGGICNFVLRKIGNIFGKNISIHDNENRDFCEE
jgi:hypothetical protein